jgi:hypothetical protein
VVVLDVVLDRGRRGRRYRTQLDAQRSRLRREQPAQRRDRGAGPVELGLESPEVVGDQRGAGVRVGGAQDAPDVGQRDVELAQVVDDLCVGNWSAV